jgi:hypothetical protein
MKCAKCGAEVGDLFCAKCQDKIRKTHRKINLGTLIPLLYYDLERRRYIVACTVTGCPCNNKGLCKTEHLLLSSLEKLMHEFDGDNIVQQVCG